MGRPIAWFLFVTAVLIGACVSLRGQHTQAPVGIFESHEDVGSVRTPGSAEYDPASKVYSLAGSGENMWFAQDEFQFVWKKVSSDFTLTADIAFPEAGGNAHKKAVLMVRQSLDTDAVYADVAVHGDGLTSLQSREETGANTHEVGINAAHPRTARLEKQGDYFFMSLAGPDQDLKFSGAAMKVTLKPPFYVGIGVCAHDKDAVAKALFSNVTLTVDAPPASAKMQRFTTEETISVASTDRRVIQVNNAEETYPGFDDMVNCFPRASPDGTQVAVVSYQHGTLGCPADQEIQLRLISLADKKVRVLAKFRGGLGTLGPSPWSADGKSIRFVSLQEIPR